MSARTAVLPPFGSRLAIVSPSGAVYVADVIRTRDALVVSPPNAPQFERTIARRLEAGGPLILEADVSTIRGVPIDTTGEDIDPGAGVLTVRA